MCIYKYIRISTYWQRLFKHRSNIWISCTQAKQPRTSGFAISLSLSRMLVAGHDTFVCHIMTHLWVTSKCDSFMESCRNQHYQKHVFLEKKIWTCGDTAGTKGSKTSWEEGMHSDMSSWLFVLFLFIGSFTNLAFTVEQIRYLTKALSHVDSRTWLV